MSAESTGHRGAVQNDGDPPPREEDRPPDRSNGGRQGIDDEPLSQAPWYRRHRLLIILGAAAIIVGGGLWWRHARQFESTDDAFIDNHFVHISPRVAGRVQEVPVNDNQDVEPGQLLVRLDPTDFQVRVDQALAALAEAESRLAQANAQQAVNQANLQQSEADAQVAQANATNAQADLERYRALSKTAPSAVSRQQYDNAVAAARSTTAQLHSAQTKVTANQAQLQAGTSQIRTAEAQLRNAEAQLRQAHLDLSYTEVPAPEGGRITRRTVTRGAWVQTGQDLMALVPREVWVTANFKETQLDLMRPGQPVDIRVDAYPDLRLRGHVDSIQRGSGPAFSLLPPENAAGNYVKVVQRVPVKIVIDDAIPADHPVGPGLSVEPTVKVR